jgi:hypothetical protein
METGIHDAEPFDADHRKNDIQNKDAQESGSIENTFAEPVDRAVETASSPLALTAIEVILDFRTLDQNRDGEITAVELIDGLRSNRQLASKYGLSDDVLDESEIRERYELTFGSIDYNHSRTVKVRTPHMHHRVLC